MTLQLIEHKVLSSAAASIEFTNIPQDGTDLLCVISGRSSRNNIEDGIGFKLNSATSGYTYRFLRGSGSSVSSQATPFEQTWAGVLSASGNTSNTFGNASIYVPNYTSSAAKSYSSDSVSETNATEAYQAITAILQSSTDPITSITISAQNGNLVQHSSATLYKITKGSDGVTTVT
jgi:hypothetical protein